MALCRAQQMSHLKQIIRDVGRAGIPTFGYYFSLAGVWGRTEGPFAEGRRARVGFANPPQTPISAGMVWNMVVHPCGSTPLALARRSGE